MSAATATAAEVGDFDADAGAEEARAAGLSDVLRRAGPKGVCAAVHRTADAVCHCNSCGVSSSSSSSSSEESAALRALLLRVSAPPAPPARTAVVSACAAAFSSSSSDASASSSSAAAAAAAAETAADALLSRRDDVRAAAGAASAAAVSAARLLDFDWRARTTLASDRAVALSRASVTVALKLSVAKTSSSAQKKKKTTTTRECQEEEEEEDQQRRTVVFEADEHDLDDIIAQLERAEAAIADLRIC